MERTADTLGTPRNQSSNRDAQEVTIVPVLQPLAKLSGPRQVLLGATALLLANSGLPWYHLVGRGFSIDLTGWHEIGTLAWTMAIGLLVFELARMARMVPMGGDEGDRVSAAGGLAVAFVGLLFVLRRLLDGDLGYGWMLGSILLATLAAASVLLFEGARGRETIAARFGEGEPPPESRPLDPDAPRPGAAPIPEWRRPQREVATASPLTASPPPPATYRSKDAEWSPGERPPWRADEDRPPSTADRLPWRAPTGDGARADGGGAAAGDGRSAGAAGATGSGGPGTAGTAGSGRPAAAGGRFAAGPDAPVVPAADAPVVPSGPGPSVAPESPREARERAGRSRGWMPPWRRGRDAGDADAAQEGRGSSAGRSSTEQGSAQRRDRPPTRRPTEDVPPWRDPSKVAPPPGGWPKSIAEKQRDEPPLWG